MASSLLFEVLPNWTEYTDLPPSRVEKGGDPMKSKKIGSTTSYYSFRIRLEKLKLKQLKTWRLIVFTKFLIFLANCVVDYLRRA